MLTELRLERAQIEEAILTMERLAPGAQNARCSRGTRNALHAKPPGGLRLE